LTPTNIHQSGNFFPTLALAPLAVNPAVKKHIAIVFASERLKSDSMLTIATSQTQYFSKPCKNPVFSHFENTEQYFEKGSSRGALHQ